MRLGFGELVLLAVFIGLTVRVCRFWSTRGLGRSLPLAISLGIAGVVLWYRPGAAFIAGFGGPFVAYVVGLIRAGVEARSRPAPPQA